MSKTKKLAIYGGEKTRKTPMPYRRLFDESELAMVIKVFEDSWQNAEDFSYQGKYEKMFCDTFIEFQGEGFADAVSSGTMAFYVCLLGLELEKGSEIVFSPVTDPGGFSPAIYAGYKPVIGDSAPGSFLLGVEQFKQKISKKTSAVVVTHIGGIPTPMDEIVAIAQKRNIKVIEDCSQAHGATYNSQKVGCFGDISFFSTMFSKLVATGGCGGLVYTKNKALYEKVRAYSDRGKSVDLANHDLKDPRTYLFPGLNCNQDELSSAIGFSTLKKLPATITRRLEIYEKIKEGLASSKAVKLISWDEHTIPALFFITIRVDTKKITVPKQIFAKAIIAEGIGVNSDYGFVISEWEWAVNYTGKQYTPNASRYRADSFNLLFNEKYGDKEVDDIVNSILKVESVFIC